ESECVARVVYPPPNADHTRAFSPKQSPQNFFDHIHYTGENKYGLLKNSLPTKNGALCVGEFFIAAVVTALIDELLGGSEVTLRGFPRVRLLAEV
ncbi:MAG: hypothetical protein AAB425_14090, partial [Bdellovibrionota bacterium]